METQTSLTHCGMCNRACAATDVCRAGACAAPLDCAELATIRVGAPSGMYAIDHDAVDATAPVMMFCDMTATGAPWTVVFATDGVALSSAMDASARWRLTTALAARSTRMLVAYRNSTGVVDEVSAARFNLPATLRTTNPFSVDRGRIDMLPITVGAMNLNVTMVYGTDTFAGGCDTNWSMGSAGRFCFQGSTAPFFAAWARPESPDKCSLSNQSFNQTDCSNDRRFSIAVAR